MWPSTTASWVLPPPWMRVHRQWLCTPPRRVVTSNPDWLCIATAVDCDSTSNGCALHHGRLCVMQTRLFVHCHCHCGGNSTASDGALHRGGPCHLATVVGHLRYSTAVAPPFCHRGCALTFPWAAKFHRNSTAVIIAREASPIIIGLSRY